MRIVGIDPGFQGAIAVLEYTPSQHPDVIKTFDMPIIQAGKRKEVDLKEIVSICSPHEVHCVFLEKAQVMPQQGIVSSGNYMKNYGMILGCLLTIGCSVIEVSPQKWKKGLGLSHDKEASVLMVRHLFPAIQITRKKDHNKCEAILVAYWGIKYNLK